MKIDCINREKQNSLILIQGLYGEEGSPITSNRKRVSRLSMRKGRSIVHKNLEDNYGAVITANHEAIAQILEQVRKRNDPTFHFSFSDFLLCAHFHPTGIEPKLCMHFVYGVQIWLDVYYLQAKI